MDGWVKVADCAPPDDAPANALYIVWTEDQQVDVAYHYGDGEFGNPGYEDSMKVTHWMFAPEKPCE